MYRKYRAQRYPDKKWIYGYYVHEQGNDYICYMSPDIFCEVYELIDIKTLGQDTGITDCKNVEIYEGDIIKSEGIISLGYVVFVDGAFWMAFASGGSEGWHLLKTLTDIYVVGHIPVNYKLIKGAKANGKNQCNF